jgi:cell wall-associated NlpC family hydrolase
MADPYIGRPYREEASGPDAYDCKGLVRAVQRAVWGREVPPLAGTLLAWRDACRAAGWAPTDDAPAAGDVLSVHAVDGPHVGVFVRAGRRLLVLHARSRIVRGVQVGRVERHALADLLTCGYTRPQVWRCA